MALNHIEMGRMTLDEFEMAASRFAAAIAVLREAQALLGGSPQPQSAAVAQAAIPAPIVDPEKQKALEDWRNSPERARLLAQIRPEEPEVAQ